MVAYSLLVLLVLGVVALGLFMRYNHSSQRNARSVERDRARREARIIGKPPER